jgi:hypothetical protein
LYTFFLQDSTVFKIFPSLSYVTEQGNGKMKDGKIERGVRNTRRTGFFPHVLSLGGLLLPPHTQTAGQCIFVFVMVNDAQRCFPTTVQLPSFHFLKRKKFHGKHFF